MKAAVMEAYREPLAVRQEAVGSIPISHPNLSNNLPTLWASNAGLSFFLG